MMILLFLMPLAGVCTTWYFNGLLKLYKKKSRPYPSAVLLICLPVFGAVLCVFRAYNLYGFAKNAWSLLTTSSVILTGMCIGICWRAISGEKNKLPIYFSILVLAAVYSFSLLIFSNCYYDKSAPAVWKVQVSGKRVSRGRSTSYYLGLSAWGRHADGKEVTVSRAFFDQVDIQDSVRVYLKQGKWGVPWYWVGK